MPLKDQPCIVANNLNYCVGNHLILRDVSFSIHTGDYVGLVGPNGGGKTTLLKIILGLLKPTSGSVLIFGNASSRETNRKIGYVPQKVTQSLVSFPTTVLEVVQSGRTVQCGFLQRFHQDSRCSKRRNIEAVEKAMEITGIVKHRDKLLTDLSGGERQRVFIARALASEPSILILDEPTTGVDIPHQEKFYAFLRKLHEQFRLTILFVTHDVDFIAREVSRVLCLNQSLFCHQSPRDFFTQEVLEKVYGENSKIILHKHV